MSWELAQKYHERWNIPSNVDEGKNDISQSSSEKAFCNYVIVTDLFSI